MNKIDPVLCRACLEGSILQTQGWLQIGPELVLFFLLLS